MMRLLLITLLAISAGRTGATQPEGITLLYIYGPDCGACMQFMAEAGKIYPRTQESKLLPMTQVTLDDWRAGGHPLAACEIGPVFGTPTYIQVVECREIDRITGYSNDELWWFSLKRMIDRLPPAAGDHQPVSAR